MGLLHRTNSGQNHIQAPRMLPYLDFPLLTLKASTARAHADHDHKQDRDRRMQGVTKREGPFVEYRSDEES